MRRRPRARLILGVMVPSGWLTPEQRDLLYGHLDSYLMQKACPLHVLINFLELEMAVDG
jgi:hypothetical protein